MIYHLYSVILNIISLTVYNIYVKSSDFFPTYGDSFFSILSSKNKDIYLDCLFELYKRLKRGDSLDIERDIAVAVIKNYIRVNRIERIDEEDENDLPNSILRRFKETHWIDEEIDNSYNRTIIFTPIAAKIIKLIDDLPDPIISTTTTEIKINDLYQISPLDNYVAHIFTIFTLIKNYKDSDSHLLINSLYNEMNALTNCFISVANNITSYIQRSLRKTAVENILDLHFDKYMNDQTSMFYQQLKTTDNIYKYKTIIMKQLIDLQLDKEYYKELTQKEQSMLREIYAFFDSTIDNLARDVDSRNSEYIRATINRIKFITAHHEDVKGELTKILQYLSNEIRLERINEDDVDLKIFENSFPLSFASSINEKSLFVPTSREKNFNPSEIAEETIIDQDYIDQQSDKLKNIISIDSTSRYADRLLQGKEEYYGHQFPLTTIDDYLCFLGVIVYSTSLNVSYTLDFLDSEVEIEHTRFKDFIIRRKL